MMQLQVRTVEVLRYVTPLREGGSLPAIVEADDGASYVIKFRGAGQGKKALIAEWIGGELARALRLRVPELVLAQLDGALARLEGDEEIQDLLKFSHGLNLGLQYLAGAITYDPIVSRAEPLEASLVVLLDSLITNIDRTSRNTNLLNWQQELWLIDHGASLYFHHNWDSWEAMAGRTFPAVKDHVLLPKAAELPQAAAILRERLSEELIQAVITALPEDWLQDEDHPSQPEEKRRVYQAFLQRRLANLNALTQEASDARATHL